jgi:type IV secretion system protein TrbL
MAIADPGILDDVLKAFTSVINSGFLRLTPGAMHLLRQMAVCETVFAMSLYMFSSKDVLRQGLMMSIKLGFFAIMVSNLQYLSEAFLNMMIWGGLTVGGSKITNEMFLSPGTVFLQGIDTTKVLLAYVENLKGYYNTIINLPVIGMYSLMVLICWICYFLIGCHIVVAVVEFQLVTVMALMLLPWGVFNYTAFIAELVIGGILGAAVRLGVLAAVMSIGLPIIQTLVIYAPSGEVPWTSGIGVCAASGIFLLCSWAAPNFAASLLGTGPALTGSSVVKLAAASGYAAARGISGAVHGGQKAYRAIQAHRAAAATT